MKEFWVIVSENNEASWGLIAKCGELARERGLLLRAYRVPSWRSGAHGGGKENA